MLQEQVERMNMEVKDKVDRQNLEIIIHEKYVAAIIVCYVW